MERVTHVVFGILLVLLTLVGTAYAMQGQINVNTATAEELTMLPQIGEATARNIVDFRTANGEFTSVDDLTKVKGIGQAKLNKIKAYLKLEGKSDFEPAEPKPAAKAQAAAKKQ